MGHIHTAVGDRISAAVQRRQRFRDSPRPPEDFLLSILTVHEKRAPHGRALYIIADRIEGPVVHGGIEDRLEMTSLHGGEGFDTQQQFTVSDIRDCADENEPLGLHIVRAAYRLSPVCNSVADRIAVRQAYSLCQHVIPHSVKYKKSVTGLSEPAAGLFRSCFSKTSELLPPPSRHLPKPQSRDIRVLRISS